MKRIIRMLILTVIGLVVIGGVAMGTMMTRRRTDVSTRVERKSLRFYKQGNEWFADVAGHTQDQNQMVAGADNLLDTVANGKSEVNTVLSADLENPDQWIIHLHLVEHDKFGATYRVRRTKSEDSSLAWLCNVTHDVFGGEHPKDIYIHSLNAK